MWSASPQPGIRFSRGLGLVRHRLQASNAARLTQLRSGVWSIYAQADLNVLTADWLVGTTRAAKQHSDDNDAAGELPGNPSCSACKSSPEVGIRRFRGIGAIPKF